MFYQLKFHKCFCFQGTSEELKAGRLLPQQAKDNECERILAKIAVHDDWVKSCWSEAKQNKKVYFLVVEIRCNHTLSSL